MSVVEPGSVVFVMSPHGREESWDPAIVAEYLGPGPADSDQVAAVVLIDGQLPQKVTANVFASRDAAGGNRGGLGPDDVQTASLT